MKRRAFLQAGALLPGIAVPGRAWTSWPSAPASETEVTPGNDFTALSNYSAEEHRRRFRNIALCEHGIRKCMRKHLITEYIPGQCCYNLGEYPCREPWNPDDWDEHELDKLKDEGIGLIQLHEEWNDPLRLFGADKFRPLNPAGFRRFVDMVHRRKMKVIVYASSGYFDRRDPDFHRDWAREDLVEFYYQYAACSPASPGWRAYLLPRLTRLMDEYGVDGIYNDMGYFKLAGNRHPPARDEEMAFEESANHDGALEDLLALIYAEIKRRGGIVKLHHSATNRPDAGLKVYDYLWVGESVQKGDGLREAVKNYAPYVVPCLDMSRAKIENEDELYLHAIPYMQFPLLLAGRPFTGERSVIPGIEYRPEQTDFWTRHVRAIWKFHQEHPEGPHSYGWWDSVPGRPEARPVHARWLRQYLPLVEQGTWTWLEVGESNLFKNPLAEGMVASAFANRELYLVLANYGHQPVEVETSEAYAPVVGGVEAAKHLRLGGRSFQILKRSARG